jgi:eukaryotic-like serine/threonine-protein kinase
MDQEFAASAGQADARAGRRIGPYEIVREIGRGGMGVVYLARRADDEFNKLVALKVLSNGFNAQEILARFRHERQILAAFSHPNIATLLDGGSTETGEPYFVMEYVEGIELDRYCDQHNLTVAGRIALFRQVCSAVGYVHQHLIVHRDLKPGNILVTAEGIPKLLDFGIAKILKPELLMTVVEATTPNALMMTPAYASPEQVRGEPISTASDIYALGVILYQLLTGRTPYKLKTVSPHELWRAIMEDQPEKPSAALTRAAPAGELTTITVEEVSRQRGTVPDKLYRHLQGDLDNILLKAMRKEPDRRYASAEQFSDDLDRYLQDLPVSAHPDSVGYRTRKFLQRHKLSVAAAAVAVVSLVTGMVATVIEAREARAERAVAEARFQDVRKLATVFLFNVHDAIQNLPGSTPASLLIVKTGTEYLDRLARESHGDVALEQELAGGYVRIGDVEGNPYSANLGDTAQAIQSYRKALAIVQRLVAERPSDPKSLRLLAEVQRELGAVLPFDGKAAEGVGHCREALRISEKLQAAHPGDVDDTLDISRAEELLGDVLGGAQSVNLGRPGEAVAAYQRALDVLPKLPASDPRAKRVLRARAVMIAKIASLEVANRNGPEALGRFNEALGFAEQLSQADPQNQRTNDMISGILNRLAVAQEMFGDPKAAVVSFQRALDINDAELKIDPHNSQAQEAVFVTVKNMGDLYFYSIHDMHRALELYRRAADVGGQLVRADPNNTVWPQRLSETLTYIGSCLFELGDKDGARRESKRGLVIAKELADRPHATRDQVYNYAWLAATVDPSDLQDPKGALPYALKAVQMSGRPDELALHVLSQCYAGIGNYPLAIATEERALALFPPVPAGTTRSKRQLTLESALKSYRDALKKQRR